MSQPYVIAALSRFDAVVLSFAHDGARVITDKKRKSVYAGSQADIKCGKPPFIAELEALRVLCETPPSQRKQKLPHTLIIDQMTLSLEKLAAFRWFVSFGRHYKVRVVLNYGPDQEPHPWAAQYLDQKLVTCRDIELDRAEDHQS